MSDAVSHIFISYSRRDMSVMYRVRDHLRGEGLDVWTDEALVPGTPEWEREIQNAIKNSGCMTVLLSPDANESLWVNREISFADEFSKRIYPILVSGTGQTSIPLRLINHQRLDIRQDEHFASEMAKLVQTVCQYLGVESAPAARERTRREDDERRKAEEEAERLRIIEEARKRADEISQARKRREEEARQLAEQLERERREEEEAQRELERLGALRSAAANPAISQAAQPSSGDSTPAVSAVSLQSAGAPAVSIPVVEPKRELPPLPPLRESDRQPEPLTRPTTPMGLRRLIPPNPLNMLRLLWWWLFVPKRLETAREKIGEGRFQVLASWLASTLIWLPILVLSLPFVRIFGFSNDWYDFSVIPFTIPSYMLIAVLAAWLLTAIFGNIIRLKWVALVAAALLGFIVMYNASLGWVFRGIPSEMWKPLGITMLLVLAAEVVPYIFSIENKNYLNAAVAAGATGGVAGGAVNGYLYFTSIGFLSTILIVGFTAGVIYLFFRLTPFLERTLSRPRRRTVSLAMLLALIVANALIMWLALTDSFYLLM